MFISLVIVIYHKIIEISLFEKNIKNKINNQNLF